MKTALLFIVPLANLMATRCRTQRAVWSLGLRPGTTTHRSGESADLGLAADNRSPRRCAHEDQTSLQWSTGLESNDQKSCSGRSAFVPVMEPAHFRDGDDVACTGKLYTAWIRRILFQCQVRASPMIITCEQLKVSRQTALVQYHHVVEAFATDCAHDPFNIRTLPW